MGEENINEEVKRPVEGNKNIMKSGKKDKKQGGSSSIKYRYYKKGGSSSVGD